MAPETMNAIDACKEHIASHKSFVLRGGAGSGKTESLKELLLYLYQSNPNAKVICITHTNAAVQEITNRVSDRYPVTTIHSFLYSLIGNYKKNIKSVIDQLFHVPLMIREEKADSISDADYKKAEHEKYKKTYSKYSSKLYSICKENCEKVVGKRDYDKNPELYNEQLNNRIKSLNAIISGLIRDKSSSSIYYNETKFNSLNELSYGHDGLLVIFHLLFEKYPLLGKIIADKYDYVFIDEYQDTRSEILNDLLSLPTKYGLTIGLFGDSMQSIYSDGVGDVEEYVNKLVLAPVPKPDNYRCSFEVIDIINKLRFDNIVQSVALKRLPEGDYETPADRHGSAKILYALTDKKPTAFSSAEDKEKHQILINQLLLKAQEISSDSKVLILTNKAIAEKNGFQYLYKIFDDRYIDVSDRIENYLRSIQALDVSDLCHLYLKKDYNALIKLVRKGGYVIHSIADKQQLHDIIHEIIDDHNLSVSEVIEKAISYKLLKRAETFQNIAEKNSNFLNQLNNDAQFQLFKKLYLEGQNTFNKIKDSIDINSEEEFDYYHLLFKRERFITELFSSSLKFSEILNFSKYLNEETEYITMHKTKGTSIPSVIVVMEEYFWNEYDFSLLYKTADNSKREKAIRSQKLIYVACSRAKHNLICIKVLTSDEVPAFLQRFPEAELIDDIVVDS